MVNVITIKAFQDNYIWLIKDSQSQHCIIVDPGDAAPVLLLVENEQLIIDAILLTHHHADHTGGVQTLIAQDENILIYSKNKMFQSSQLVAEGDTISFFDGRFSLQVMEVPGHTLDHVAFYNKQLLFCGDSLFSGGCGRVFEGSFGQMFSALSRLADLDDKTKVYCAHEYTQNNLIFAHHIEPKNVALLNYIQQVSKKRQQGLPTIPSTVGLEKAINPFLRCDQQTVINNLQAHLGEEIRDPLSCFAALRNYKNDF
ncbi:hydroxyacylglutathione hydrolase [Psychromonas sp.]|uniref:hydroxyacylglutathione hydrolase n=1 Tax=Psychromonas sp. TaxID=1884585 RepID=UPI00356A0CB2